jgi:hypothetical protein
VDALPTFRIKWPNDLLDPAPGRALPGATEPASPPSLAVRDGREPSGTARFCPRADDVLGAVGLPHPHGHDPETRLGGVSVDLGLHLRSSATRSGRVP